MFDDDREECLTNCYVSVRAGSSTTSAVHRVEAEAVWGEERTTSCFHVDSSGVTHLFDYVVCDDGIEFELERLEEAQGRDETLLGKDLAKQASEDANAGVVLFYVMEPSDRGDFERDLSRFDVDVYLDGEVVEEFESSEPSEA